MNCYGPTDKSFVVEAANEGDFILNPTCDFSVNPSGSGVP